ncbi:VOC family protein [Pseudonocardia humida]|uniref:VOC family protein n=1 Tax=Pseudonocardia humida TaxID=2800819 RepID=A0ABT0ZRV9_9PSEU|nr:VOC family protein [Pseudonocardia humida]MCO1653444.1 VOC family protein [Pseudonocardia humida]
MSARVSAAVVAVADQDVMIEFFVSALGFEVGTDAEMWPGARWVDLTPAGGGTRVVLSAAADFDREPDRRYPMILEAPDVAAEAARLRAAGLPVSDPTTEAWGTYVRVTDPEGRELMITERG